ncbi:unnamed protein product [Natator depressus]
MGRLRELHLLLSLCNRSLPLVRAQRPRGTGGSRGDPTQPGMAPAPTNQGSPGQLMEIKRNWPLEPSYPKPNISLHPSGEVAPGGAMAIRCECRCRGARVLLYKAGDPEARQGRDPPEDVAQFFIHNVSQRDAGSCSCRYSIKSDLSVWSEPSDAMELVVAEPSLPKPSISLSPSWGVSLGGAVSVWCRGQRQGMRFVLNKEGRHFPPVASNGLEAVFHISNVSREDGGSYSCSYQNRSGSAPASSPSDPVELAVRDPSLPRPSISLSPTGVTAPGADVTIRCQGQRRDVRFFLHKAGDRDPPRHMDPAGDGAEFHIPTVGRQHGGSYSCSYRPPSEPFISSDPSDPVQLVVAEPSDPVELVVADPSLPRPSISLSPTGVTAPGADVTIRCEGQRRDVRFFLHKAGDRDPPRHKDPAGDGAEFRIPTVGRLHGGSYSCSYRPRSEPFVSSDPSDPVQLVVAEPSYPKPSISLSPSGGVSLGGAVSVWCRGQHRDMQFVLNKEGRHFPPVDPNGLEAVFPISNVSREHGGSYSCSYHSRSKPSARSSPSDPVELVVRDPSLPRPSISLSPTGVTAPGADVTIRCEGQRRDVRFFLHKAGDLNPPRDMDPAGDGAEFHIPTVGRQHGGNYSCSYRPPSEPFVSSDPSDPVELVVAEPSDPVELVVAEGSLPKASISVSPGGVIPVGGNVTIQCWHQRLGMRFLLYKDGDGNYLRYTDPAGYVAEFPIPSARREHGGSYTCRYSYRTDRAAYSEPSDPVQIIVAELSSPKPSISMSPSGGVALRGAVTLRRRVSRADGGSYTCYYPPDSDPDTRSEPSDPVESVVADPSLPRPSISLSPTGVTTPGANVTIRCRGQRWDVRFFLHKAGDRDPPRYVDPSGDGAEFRIPSVGRQHGGSYSCSYWPPSEPFVSLDPSDPVQLVVAGGSKSPALSGLTSPIIAGASAAAAVLLLLLLLLVAFFCFRKTRVRKGAAPRPRSAIPLGVLKAPAQQDPIYSSVDEGKETQTLPQEPDPGTDGLTYAELDRQALHAKPGGPAPAPEPTQPSVYAAINVSRGAPQ